MAQLSSSEFLINTQPHPRKGTYQIIVRDLLKHVNVHQFPGGQTGARPQTIQILSNGHLVIGYSKVRPHAFDFWNEEGELYNRIESDADKCFVLQNGLLIEVGGKQTIVKQILPEFKAPRVVQIYDFEIQWCNILEHDVLIAQRTDSHSLLYFLSLGTSIPRLVVPIYITNLQLDGNVLYGTTPQGDFIQRIDLSFVLDHKTLQTQTAPLDIRRHKVNEIQLCLINDRFTLYRNYQKHHVRDVGQSVIHLVDWAKHESVWNSTQDISIVATSPDGYFVYCDNDTHSYFFIVCGSSLALPIPLLNGLKPKGESRFVSNGTFVFHGEKKIILLDIENSVILAQYDVTRHACDLMTVSQWNYRPKPKPVEIDIREEVKELNEVKDVKDVNEMNDVKDVKRTDVLDVSDAKHVAEIQRMVDKSTQSEPIPPPPPVFPPPLPPVFPPPPPPPEEPKKEEPKKEEPKKEEPKVEASSCTVM